MCTFLWHVSQCVIYHQAKDKPVQHMVIELKDRYIYIYLYFG